MNFFHSSFRNDTNTTKILGGDSEFSAKQEKINSDQRDFTEN